MSTENTENTPLLAQTADQESLLPFSENQKDTKGNSTFWQVLVHSHLGNVLLGVLSVFMVLLFLVWIIGPLDLTDQLATVPKVSLDTFAVDRLTDDGLNIKVAGQVIADYSDINGTFRGSIIRTIGGWLQNVDVRNSTLDIFFEDEDWKHGDQNETAREARTVRATIPPIKVDIRQGHNTSFNIVTTLSDFGSSDVIESIVDRLIHSEEVKFVGRANITAGKFGVFVGPIPLAIKESINKPDDDDDDDDDKPGKPGKSGFNISDISISSNHKSSLDVGLSAFVDNNYGVSGYIPPLSWVIGIEGCENGSKEIVSLAEGLTSPIVVEPFSAIKVGVSSSLTHFSPELLNHCSGDRKTPLDRFVSNYLNGMSNKITIAGATQDILVPKWFQDLMDHVQIKLNFAAEKRREDTIEEVLFENLQLDLPESRNPFVKPKSPPRISAIVTAVARAPAKMDIDQDLNVAVINSRGDCNLFYEGKEFAQMNLNEWVPCLTRHGKDGTFMVSFALDSVPLNITDQAAFGRVLQTMLVNGEAPIRIEAIADAEISTPIGEFVFTELPAQGDTIIRSA